MLPRSIASCFVLSAEADVVAHAGGLCLKKKRGNEEPETCSVTQVTVLSLYHANMVCGGKSKYHREVFMWK